MNEESVKYVWLGFVVELFLQFYFFDDERNGLRVKTGSWWAKPYQVGPLQWSEDRFSPLLKAAGLKTNVSWAIEENE